jgi:hypothetical protein
MTRENVQEFLVTHGFGIDQQSRLRAEESVWNYILSLNDKWFIQMSKADLIDEQIDRMIKVAYGIREYVEVVDAFVNEPSALSVENNLRGKHNMTHEQKQCNAPERKRRYQYDWLTFTTLPPDLDFIQSPLLSELEEACIQNRTPEAFRHLLAAENSLWNEMDRRLLQIDEQALDVRPDEEYEPVEWRLQAEKWRVSVPFKSRIHQMRLDLIAQTQVADRPC